MATLILFNKPFDVVCQFRNTDDRSKTLSDYINFPGVYAAGRLDKDSEGLLLLTDDGQLQHALTNPDKNVLKTYFVQVEGTPNHSALQELRHGITLKDGVTKPAIVEQTDTPNWLWERPSSPILPARHPVTSWLKIRISEGRNRQVRRMTAAVGLPTLRLIRTTIGRFALDNIPSGEYNQLSIAALQPKKRWKNNR